VPFQPWAKAVYDDRQKNELEPHTRASRPVSRGSSSLPMVSSSLTSPSSSASTSSTSADRTRIGPSTWTDACIRAT
jgi:hypothetical protein